MRQKLLEDEEYLGLLLDMREQAVNEEDNFANVMKRAMKAYLGRAKNNGKALPPPIAKTFFAPISFFTDDV